MPNGLDDLERAAAARSARRTRQPPPPRNPRKREDNPEGEPPPEQPAQQPEATGNQVAHGRESAASAVVLAPAAFAQSFPKVAQALPRPHAPLSHEAVLLPEERAELDRCEDLLRAADLAFWVRGRMMATINSAELHREKYKTFEEYCRHEWELSPSRVYQLIDAWELAEYLATTLTQEGVKPKLNEGQVRELLGFARRHGNEAAARVYQMVGRGGRRVTAKLLATVVDMLPNDEFDPEKAGELIEAYFAEGAPVTVERKDRDVAEVVHSTVARLVRLARDKTSASRIADELEQTAAELRAKYT